MTITKRKQATKRNSRIYTELALMSERLLGRAPEVNTEEYQKLMKVVRKYFTPFLVEQEKGQTK